MFRPLIRPSATFSPFKATGRRNKFVSAPALPCPALIRARAERELAIFSHASSLMPHASCLMPLYHLGSAASVRTSM